MKHKIVVLIGSLPSLNDVIEANRRNKYAGAKMKKTIQNSIGMQIMSQCKDKFDMLQINIKWYEKNRKRDYDNVSSSKKFILDALVQCKIIANDGQKNIYPKFIDEFYLDRDNPRVEIELIERGVQG